MTQAGLAAEMRFVMVDDRCWMLKITVLDGVAGQKVMVEGKLTEPWVSELESAWNQARRADGNREIVVDLSEVTSIDPRGKAALMTLIADGARLVGDGIYTKYLIEKLTREAKIKSHGNGR